MEYQADRSQLMDSDLEGIKDIMRIHIEIRNRSFMRRVHRDCFLGSDAVDFLVSHGLADSRQQAVEIGRKMQDRSILRHVTDNSKFKDASHLYFRFIDDDGDDSQLAATNAGNGGGTVLGQGGNKWSFCPHTVHNSYIIDIGLAEEIERAVAGPSVEARKHAFEKLRNRVREEADADAPDWMLSQSQEVHSTKVSVYQRKRPRGDFKNLKMTGMVGESPKAWIRGILSFEKRKVWESQFEDGVVVEAVDLGEQSSLLVGEAGEEFDSDKDDEIAMAAGGADTSTPPAQGSGIGSALRNNKDHENDSKNPGMGVGSGGVAVGGGQDDVLAFLQTVELAGIPTRMSIAYLNDPDRQHALAHLRKQMMLSSPQECMLCQHPFESPADIRFCPCCAMVSCPNCVCKRIFEAASRQVVNVCLHCYRESSRIRHPPSAIKNNAEVDANMRGKWWRPEELNLVDYSSSFSCSVSGSGFGGRVNHAYGDGGGGGGGGGGLQGIGSLSVSMMGEGGMDLAANALMDAANSQSASSHNTGTSGNNSMSQGSGKTSNDNASSTQSGNTLTPGGGLKRSSSKPLLVGMDLVDALRGENNNEMLDSPTQSDYKSLPPSSRGGSDTSSVHTFNLSGLNDSDQLGHSNPPGKTPSTVDNDDDDMFNLDDDNDDADNDFDEDSKNTNSMGPKGKGGDTGDGVGREIDEEDENALGVVPQASAAHKIVMQITKETYATCKNCGDMLPRDVDSIEKHMDICKGSQGKASRQSNQSPKNNQNDEGRDRPPIALQRSGGSFLHRNNQGQNITQAGTRIIYRTARQQDGSGGGLFSSKFRPREVCALQDSFVDPDGTSYVYEISVRHCDVHGTPGYVTADVLLQLHMAKPVKGSPNTSFFTIVSQVDTRAKGTGQWLLSLMGENGANAVGVPCQDDLIRELQAGGPLINILKPGGTGNGGLDDTSGDDLVSLDDFELMAVLGRGGFGKVMQVRYKPSQEIYAMKILKKQELVKRRQVERTQTERTILAAVKHPFIVCLHYAFQSTTKLYMVMDFVQGGDFFTLMRKHRRLPEEWVRIYIGEIALALQHLHDMDVVYRDLKPENILLCSDGHLKLTDFGLSRFFETRPPAPEDMIGEDDIITRSFCGTEQYMSPEMLLQQGHNFRMDWWCVGLIMHEMISAKHPFHGPSHYDTLRNMVTKQPVIDNRLTVHAATVVRSMLIKNPRARLCCRSGVEELKSLPFFASLDWTALYEKRISMAYLPELKGVEDVSSFESTFTREEAVDSVTSEGATSAKKKKGGGILGLFGLGGGADKDEKDPEDMDSFRDFGFVKTDEDAPGTDSTVTSPTAAAAGGNDAAADTSSGGGGNGTESTVPQTIFVPAEPIRKNKAAQ